MGVKIFLKSIITFDNTSFQPEWTKGLLESPALSRWRQPSVGSLPHVSHERSDVRKVSPWGHFLFPPQPLPRWTGEGPHRLRQQPPGETGSPAGRWQM